MKNKILFISLLIILFSLMTEFVFSDCTGLNNASLIAYYSFDVDCETDDGGNGYNGVNDGADNVNGKIGNACDFEIDNTDIINISAIFATFAPEDDWTTCHWVKMESWPTDMISFGISDFNANSFTLMYLDQSDGNLEVYSTVTAEGTNLVGYGNYNNDADYHYFCMVMSANGGILTNYVDGSDAGSDIDPSLNHANLDYVSLGAWYQSGSGYGGHYDGIIDEVVIWQSALSDSDLDLMYNSGDGCQILTTSPTMSINTDIVNDSKIGFIDYSDGIYYFNLNATLTLSDDDLGNVSIYINDTLNTTYNDINLSLNTQINYTFINEEKGVWLNISITNVNITGSEEYWLYFDGINPELDLDGVINNTYYFKNLTASDFYFNATCSDTNLFAVNFSLVDSGDNVKSQYFEDNIVGSTVSNYTVFSLQDQTEGVYDLILECWDDHHLEGTPLSQDPIQKTSKEIDFKGVKITSNEEIGYIIEDYKVRITSESKSLTNSQYICYETQGEFKKRPYSRYKEHYVTLKENIWIDEYKHTYELQNKNKLCLFGLDNKYVSDSIGDLNYIIEIYQVYLNESFYVYARDINTNDTITDYTATLFNATYSVEKSTTSGIIAFNITQGNYSINITSESYQYSDVNDTPLSEGGSYTFYLTAENAVYVYFYDEVTKEIIDDRTVYFSLISDDFAQNYTTTTGSKATTATSGSYDIVYWAENYTKRFDYFELQNDTANLTLYLLEEAVDDTVSMYVYDEVSNPVEDAFIYVYRYDLTTNTDLLMVTRRTNFEGKADVNLELDSEYYKFKIYYNSELKYETERSYISSTSLTWTINTQEPILQDYYNLGDCSGFVTFDEPTLTFIFTYQDPTNTHVTQGCFEIYRVSINGETLYNETCVSGSGATININVANVSGARYVGKGFVTLDGTEYLFDTYSYTFSEETAEDFGNFGVFLTIFLTILVGLLALYDVATGLALLGIPMLIMSGLGILNLGVSYALGIEVIFIVLALMIRNK